MDLKEILKEVFLFALFSLMMLADMSSTCWSTNLIEGLFLPLK